MAPKVPLLPVMLLAGAMMASCEAYPVVATKVQLPPGIRADPAYLHLETSSSKQVVSMKKLEPAGFLEIHPDGNAFDVLFATRIGTETFTYARVWLDVNKNGVFDAGDAAGELAPAPFRATDPGALGFKTNRNVAPPIRLTTNP